MNKWIASFFGLGFIPFAPGTFGAIGACVIYFLLFFTCPESDWIPLYLIGLILFFTISGIAATDAMEKEWGKDPSKVVVDEAVGLWIALLFVPFSIWNILIGLALFRFFDISKILGIRKMEELPGGIGVMMDDILAGIYSCIVLHIIIKFAPF